jgi:O-glycosyl hydrolase
MNRQCPRCLSTSFALHEKNESNDAKYGFKLVNYSIFCDFCKNLDVKHFKLTGVNTGLISVQTTPKVTDGPRT